jgi:nitrite reductase/ring-hydroxylating ferredoxin subunit
VRRRGVLLFVAVCALAAGAAIAFVLVVGGPGETLSSQQVASASEVTASPLAGSVRARQGADRLLQRERTGYPCGFVFPGAVPTMGCPLSTPVRMVPLLLVRDSADTIRAFIGEDPRNGCVLVSRTDLLHGVFYDPCHGSIYDRQGRVVGGPSPWDLNEWAVEVRDGKVFVDPSKIITGTARLGTP